MTRNPAAGGCQESAKTETAEHHKHPQYRGIPAGVMQTSTKSAEFPKRPNSSPNNQSARNAKTRDCPNKTVDSLRQERSKPLEAHNPNPWLQNPNSAPIHPPQNILAEFPEKAGMREADSRRTSTIRARHLKARSSPAQNASPTQSRECAAQGLEAPNPAATKCAKPSAGPDEQHRGNPSP